MNPFELDATGLMVWGLVAHLVADWLLQNEWMALNKMKRQGFYLSVRGWRPLLKGAKANRESEITREWDSPVVRHPAAYVHAGIHAVLLAPVFGWAALALAAAHLFIDLRFPVAWWSRLMRQTQPGNGVAMGWPRPTSPAPGVVNPTFEPERLPLFDIGADVRIWNDQVWHIACIAVAALIVGASA